MYLFIGEAELDDDDFQSTNLADAMDDYDEDDYQEWKPQGNGNFCFLRHTSILILSQCRNSSTCTYLYRQEEKSQT